MMWSLVLVCLSAEQTTFTSPASPQPEYGYLLTADEAREGWIALFDGETTFGWSDAAVENKALTRGQTTSPFHSCEFKGEAVSAGRLTIGDQTIKLDAGRFQQLIKVGDAGPIK